MAKKSISKEVSIVDNSGIFRTFSGKYNFEGISTVRKLISNEKTRLLHTIKKKKPTSIYELSKILGRDFKSVSDDIKFLDKLGFIDLISERSGERQRLRPVLIADSIKINISI